MSNPLTVEDCGAARDLGDVHQNPDLALRLDENGVPVWWPLREEGMAGRRLSQREREDWYLRWLGGELNAIPRTHLTRDAKPRRQTIARSLLHTHSDLSDGYEPTLG